MVTGKTNTLFSTVTHLCSHRSFQVVISAWSMLICMVMKRRTRCESVWGSLVPSRTISCIFLFVDAGCVLYNIKCYHGYLERLKMLLWVGRDKLIHWKYSMTSMYHTTKFLFFCYCQSGVTSKTNMKDVMNVLYLLTIFLVVWVCCTVSLLLTLLDLRFSI